MLRRSPDLSSRLRHGEPNLVRDAVRRPSGEAEIGTLAQRLASGSGSGPPLSASVSTFGLPPPHRSAPQPRSAPVGRRAGRYARARACDCAVAIADPRPRRIVMPGRTAQTPPEGQGRGAGR